MVSNIVTEYCDRVKIEGVLDDSTFIPLWMDDVDDYDPGWDIWGKNRKNIQSTLVHNMCGFSFSRSRYLYLDQMVSNIVTVYCDRVKIEGGLDDSNFIPLWMMSMTSTTAGWSGRRSSWGGFWCARKWPECCGKMEVDATQHNGPCTWKKEGTNEGTKGDGGRNSHLAGS